jgi:protoheme IX farnesyltransferase
MSISVNRVTRVSGAVASVADYVALTKPRVVSLLVVTGVCGYLAGAAGHGQIGVLLAVAGGGALAAGGANALNCVFDRDLDATMARTRNRPIPGGRVPVLHAVALGIAMNAVAALWLDRSANLLAAALALAGTAWYLVVYTAWLKRRSTQNIVIGGAAGCFPPLVGWAAATGTLDATALTLAGVIFLWTPPHFWALATLLRRDYRRAGIPMLPAVVSVRRTANQAFVYAVATVVVSLAPVLWGGAGALYTVSAAGLGGVFVSRAEAFRRDADTATARRLFRYSLVYLAALFVALVVDRMLAG